MFQRFHKMREEREQGFTLIELLVVILIIAILAAIAIPVFLSQREKGWKSQLESALKNAATSAESYASDTNGGDGDYELMDRAALDAQGLKVAGDVTIDDAGVTESADFNSFCISGTHARLTGVTMAVSSADSRPTEVTSCTAGVKVP